jgi:DNA-directed RNA polymerase specialized sigma24 family protein
MTADYLRNVERIYRGERADLEKARERRNAAVRQAISEGWTHEQIADATGITRGRIGQIATRRG